MRRTASRCLAWASGPTTCLARAPASPPAWAVPSSQPVSCPAPVRASSSARRPLGRSGLCSRGPAPSPSGACRTAFTDSHGRTHFGAPSPYPWPRWAGNAAALTVGIGALMYAFGNDRVPYTGRQRLLLITTSQERSLGAAEFRSVKQRFKGDILPPLHPLSLRVQRVGRRVAALAEQKPAGPASSSATPEPWRDLDAGGSSASASGAGAAVLPHMRRMTWEFIVVDKPLVNAFVLPGGKVVVFAGLLKLFPGDDELAMVLAHEAGHVVARHAAERLSYAVPLAALQLAVSVVLGFPDLIHGVVRFVFELPNSRGQELEADQIGLVREVILCLRGPRMLKLSSPQ